MSKEDEQNEDMIDEFYASLAEINKKRNELGPEKTNIEIVKTIKSFDRVFPEGSLENGIYKLVAQEHGVVTDFDENLNKLIYDVYKVVNHKTFDILESNKLEFIGEIIQKTEDDLSDIGISNPYLIQESLWEIRGDFRMGQQIDFKRPNGKYSTISQALDQNMEILNLPRVVKNKISFVVRETNNMNYDDDISVRDVLNVKSMNYIIGRNFGLKSLNKTRVAMKQLHPSLRFNKNYS